MLRAYAHAQNMSIGRSHEPLAFQAIENCYCYVFILRPKTAADAVDLPLVALAE
jgi:hypothetical protein